MILLILWAVCIIGTIVVLIMEPWKIVFPTFRIRQYASNDLYKLDELTPQQLVALREQVLKALRAKAVTVRSDARALEAALLKVQEEQTGRDTESTP